MSEAVEMAVGSVQGLWRYPLKSALGERLVRAEVAEAGLVGDRAFAFVDRETGRIASAKRPQLWRSLLGLSAALDEATGVLAVTLPDGRHLESSSGALEAAVSEFLGRPVSLIDQGSEPLELERARPDEVLVLGIEADVATEVRTLGLAAPGSRFHDFAPVHILLTSSLRRIAEVANLSDPHSLRYRANIVIEGEGIGAFAENGWVGRRLHVGEVALEIIAPTPRCAIPILAHGTEAEANPAILRAIDRENRVHMEGIGAFPCLGIYARVLRPGCVATGDAVRLG